MLLVPKKLKTPVITICRTEKTKQNKKTTKTKTLSELDNVACENTDILISFPVSFPNLKSLKLNYCLKK